MASIPSNLSRVSNGLSSRLVLASLTGTNRAMLRVQEQLSTLKRVNRPSDDPIASSLISVFDRSLETGAQRQRNLSNADAVLGVIDQRIGSLNDLVLEAKQIASSQIGAGSDATTRAQQSTVITGMVQDLLRTINSDYSGVSLFAGSATKGAAVEAFKGGYRYLGTRNGLQADLGDGLDLPITIGANEVVGALSARHEGTVDLNPTLTAQTRLRDLRGPMEGVGTLGTVDVTVDTGTPITVSVDLSKAETLGDVQTLIESAIRQADPTALAGGFGAGVTLGSDRLSINAAAGATVTFSDGPSGSAATALGLANHSYQTGNELSVLPTGDLDPKVTADTTLGSLAPSAALDLANGITFRNGTLAGTVALSPTMTVGELAEQVKRLDLGIRVELAQNGDSINVINEVSGLRMSVEESGGSSAALLGVRTLMGSTALTTFNDGRGVEIANGNLDQNGAPDASRNVDFRITLSDGTQVDVDLTPANSATVSDVLATINAAVSAAGKTIGSGVGEFQAVLSGSGNGLVLEDRVGAGPISITSLNGHAAEDLGLLDGTVTTGPAILTSSDRSTVRVDSLFSTLVELGDSLAGNNEIGITFAGGQLETDLDRLSLARATVGSRAQRVDQESARLEDRMTLDKSLRSQVQDLDVFEASTRFNLLQTQLQAVLTTASRAVPLTLLNFL